MFGKSKREKELEAEVEHLLNALNAGKGRAYLEDITREGRMNTFTFKRGNELIQIQTMGLLGDPFHQWKKDLL